MSSRGGLTWTVRCVGTEELFLRRAPYGPDEPSGDAAGASSLASLLQVIRCGRVAVSPGAFLRHSSLSDKQRKNRACSPGHRKMEPEMRDTLLRRSVVPRSSQ